MKIDKKIIIGLVLIIGIILFSYSLEKKEFEEKEASIGGGIGAADASVIYCMELGYEGKILMDENGEYAVCIFPDNTECETWEFFRGKCGQKWSYCKQQGYDLKELGQNEGWIRGGICVTEEKKEIGTIYDLMGLRAKVLCENEL